MRKSLILLFLLLPLCGYGDDEHWDDYNYLYSKIHSWQDREKECLSTTRHLFPDPTRYQEVNMSDLHELRRDIMNDFEYVPDEEGHDYWQTSCETSDKGEGDCEDFAILVLSKLRIYYTNHQKGILIITYNRDDKHRCHGIPIIYYCEDDFLTIDRGWGIITGRKLRSEDFKTRKSITDLKFKLAFNLEDIWFL